eukprot:gene10422-14000_t
MEAINAKTTAIVFIEYQNEFTADGGKLHPAVDPVMKSSNMLANSALTAKIARDKGCKIIHCPIKFSPDFKELSTTSYGILANVKNGQCFVDGTWGSEFDSQMTPQSSDLIVAGKVGLCGFESTNLNFILAQNKIQTVVLGGFLTNCCVESTMRAAYEKGYQVITLADCTACTSPAEQDAAISYTFPMFSLPMLHEDFLAKLK